MSKYTTELRFICEQKANLNSSVNSSKVDEVVNSSWNKIFSSNWPIYNEAYREPLCKKIINHYYFYEIGFETIGLFINRLNQKMNEIMPYYNRLYLALEHDWPIFEDVDYTRTGEGNLNETKNDTDKQTHNETSTNTKNLTDTNNSTTTLNNNLTQTNTGTVSNSGSNSITDAVSDTPQGTLADLKTLNYLSRGQITNGSESGTRNDNLTQLNTGTQTTTVDGSLKHTGDDKNQIDGGYNLTKTGSLKSNKDYSERIKGKMGTKSYAEMFREFVENVRNIDMEVINELRDLFMLVW